MNEVLAGALGGLIVLGLALAGVQLWWMYEDRQINRMLSAMSNLR